MATKQELIEGVRFLAREARRAASRFDHEHWNRKTVDGWTVKEVYCHILDTVQRVTTFLPAIQNLPEGADLADLGATLSVNVDDINAQGVARNIQKTPAELVEGITAACEALVPLAEELDPGLLDKPLKYGTHDMPLSDVAATSIVLHNLAHTYHSVAAS